MPRTATRRRRGLAIALSCAAMLTACTGNADEGGAPTGDTTPAVAPDVASTTATTLLRQAVTSLADTSAGGPMARAEAFTGVALENANTWAKVLPNRTAAHRADLELSTSSPKLIGVSRSGDGPQQILVQTTLKKSGAAVLVLLVSEPAQSTQAGGFKVAAVTPMLEDSRLDPLDPASVGSEAVTDDTGAGDGLAQDPGDVVQAFADSVRYPDPAKSSLLATDALTTQLRKSAAAEAAAIKTAGAFSQTHEPKGILGGLRLLDGRGAVVFAHVLRTDGIAMRGRVKLTPSKDFTLLTGVKTITTEASLRTNELIAFVIPASGQARIIAASDQLVGGSGR